MVRRGGVSRSSIVARTCCAAVIGGLSGVALEGRAAATETVEISAMPISPPAVWHEDVEFEVTVSNPTPAAMTDVVVTAWNERNAPPAPIDAGGPVTAEGDDDVLDPGETWVYRVTLPAMPTALFDVNAMASGDAVQNSTTFRIGDYPAALRYPVEFSMQPDTTAVSPGAPLPWTVTATNIAPFPVASVTGEFRLTPPERTSILRFDPLPERNDAGNGDDVLDVGEVWIWEITTDASEGFRLEVKTAGVRADVSDVLVEPIGFTFVSSPVEGTVAPTTAPPSPTTAPPATTVAPADAVLPPTGSDRRLILIAGMAGVLGLA